MEENMKNSFKWQICDGKGRVLFGRRNDDQIIFARYPNMTEDEKNLIISTFSFIMEIPQDDKIMENKRVKEFLNYLNFQEEKDGKDDFCG